MKPPEGRSWPRRAITGAVACLLLGSGCDYGLAKSRDDGRLIQSEAESIAGKQVAPLAEAANGPADEANEEALRRAIVGRWRLRDVPPTHYRMLDEVRVEKVDRPHPAARLEFRADGVVRGTEIGSESSPEGGRALMVYDRDFEGTWAIRLGRLVTTIRRPNHTLAILESIAVEGSTLKLANPRDPTRAPKVYVRTN